MLKLRRGRVVATEPLTVRLEDAAEGEDRPAWADPALVGECRIGDEVVLNVEALDLGLGSGGFDLVCVNLTRGLAGSGSATEHVMKLNYSPLQHPVATVERAVGPSGKNPPRPERGVPVLALGLHGHLAPAAWAAGQGPAPERPRIGYVQTGGGALPGKLSRDVRELIDRGILAGHLTAGPAYGGQLETITLVGALDAADSLGWDGVIAGPGPGILGSETAFGHGGMAALEVLHAALALDLPALLVPRISAADPRPRHTGLSHHSRAVLSLCLGPVEVPVPENVDELLGDLAPEGGLPALVRGLGRGGHRAAPERADLTGYLKSGLPRRSMGRDLTDDPAFFAAPLAAGQRLAGLCP
ncbi:MAG: DUF3866 family protein [Solirubrobacterales bacterium]|nr:DUF3866 family protein [Solirubrobacterales bacterium]